MEAKFSNKSLVELLRFVAAAYTLTNENKFKIIAYQKAADTIEHMASELYDSWKDGRFEKISGIGPTIGEHIREYFERGFSSHFDKILSQIPKPVFVLMQVPSIGPKTAFKLVKELNLKSAETVVSDLKKAAEAGKIETIPTFGKKSQEEILHAIELYSKKPEGADRMPLPYAHAMAQDIIAYLKKLPIKRTDALGSLRRMVSTIGDIDIAVGTDSLDSKKIIEHFTRYPKTISIDNAGDKKASIIISPRIRVDLRVQDLKSYGSMLQYFTGSKAHNVKLREFAMKKGFSLSEWGVKKINLNKPERGDKKNTSAVKYEFKTEEELYKFFDLQIMPPEIREGTNELELARKKSVPKLVELADIKGDLHLHSSYDIQTSHDRGENSYIQLLKRADELGYQYIGFADHNPKQSGLNERQIIEIMKRRKEHIDKNNLTGLRSKYFIGLETDILPSGAIALPEKAIEYVDYLIVSVHSSFTMPREEMTKRVARALSYPKVRIFGHPTGRLLNKRHGIDLNWDTIFELVQKNNQALEINSAYERLDLPDILVREAVGEGIRCIIDTDSHATEHMDSMQFGIAVARRGWATKSDIMNTEPYDNFKSWLLQEKN